MTIYVEYRIRGLAEQISDEGDTAWFVPDSRADYFALYGRRFGAAWERIGRYRTRTEAERIFMGIAGRPYRLEETNAIDIEAHLASRSQIASIWSVEDVRTRSPNLSDDQAWQVLQIAAQRYDRTGQLGWKTIQKVLAELYPISSSEGEGS
jgi:hypothetical protein